MAAYDAFRCGDQPRLRRSAVLYLDLLGTVAPRTAAEAGEHLAKTRRALERAREWGDSDPAEATAVATWFSDNLGMAYPVTDDRPEDLALGDLLTDAGDHQLALVEHGFVARGAISLDLLYADELLIYGPGLNRAVGLEKSLARFPRVVLDEASARAARRHMIGIWGASDTAPHREQLAVDQDGVTFVDYLRGGLDFGEEEACLSLDYLQRHRDFIAARLVEHDGDPRVYEKYQWLAAYHDWVVGSFSGSPLEAGARGLFVHCSRPCGAEFRAFGDDVPSPADDA